MQGQETMCSMSRTELVYISSGVYNQEAPTFRLITLHLVDKITTHVICKGIMPSRC